MSVDVIRGALDQSIFGRAGINELELYASGSPNKMLLAFARGLLGTKLNNFELMCMGTGAKGDGVMVTAVTAIASRHDDSRLFVSIHVASDGSVSQEFGLTAFGRREWNINLSVGPEASEWKRRFERFPTIVKEQFLDVSNTTIWLNQGRSETTMHPDQVIRIISEAKGAILPPKNRFNALPQQWHLLPRLTEALKRLFTPE